MKDLIARLEASEVGSAELDYLIDEALSEWRNIGGGFAAHKVTGERRRNSFDCSAPVTTSLDAALALAERAGLQGSDIMHKAWSMMAKKHALHCRPYTGESYARDAALQACIAILKAKLAEEPTKG